MKRRKRSGSTSTSTSAFPLIYNGDHDWNRLHDSFGALPERSTRCLSRWAPEISRLLEAGAIVNANVQQCLDFYFHDTPHLESSAFNFTRAVCTVFIMKKLYRCFFSTLYFIRSSVPFFSFVPSRARAPDLARPKRFGSTTLQHRH